MFLLFIQVPTPRLKGGKSSWFSYYQEQRSLDQEQGEELQEHPHNPFTKPVGEIQEHLNNPFTKPVGGGASGTFTTPLLNQEGGGA